MARITVSYELEAGFIETGGQTNLANRKQFTAHSSQLIVTSTPATIHPSV